MSIRPYVTETESLRIINCDAMILHTSGIWKVHYAPKAISVERSTRFEAVTEAARIMRAIVANQT